MTDVIDFRKHFFFKDTEVISKIDLSLKNKGDQLLCITAHNNKSAELLENQAFRLVHRFSSSCCFGF